MAELPQTKAIDPRLQAAGLMAFAGQPGLAWEMLSDYRKRTVGRIVLKSLKEAGFPLSDPSGVVLSSLLASGAVTVDEAFQVYLQLKEAQAADLQIAARLRQIELASLQARKLQAQILRTEIQTAQDLANLYYDDSIKAIEAEIEGLREYKRELLNADYNQTRALMSAGIDPAKELKRIELREKALLQARSLQIRKKQRFVFHLTNKLRAGQPTALTGPEAIAKEELKNIGLSELAQKGQEALRDAELEVDEYFINLAETTAQIDIAKKRDSNKPLQEEIQDGLTLHREFVDVLATYVGPGYATYFDRAYLKSLQGYMASYLPDTMETEQERSFWDSFTKVAMGIGAAALTAAAAFKYGPRILSRFRKTRPKGLPSPKESPGPIQDIVEEAKRRALKAGIKLPELPSGSSRTPKALPPPKPSPDLPAQTPKGLTQSPAKAPKSKRARGRSKKTSTKSKKRSTRTQRRRKR